MATVVIQCLKCGGISPFESLIVISAAQFLTVTKGDQSLKWHLCLSLCFGQIRSEFSWSSDPFKEKATNGHV